MKILRFDKGIGLVSEAKLTSWLINVYMNNTMNMHGGRVYVARGTFHLGNYNDTIFSCRREYVLVFLANM